MRVAHMGTWPGLCGMPVLPSIFDAVMLMGAKLVDAEEAGERVQAVVGEGGILNVDAGLRWLQENAPDTFTIELPEDEVRQLLVLAIAQAHGGSVVLHPNEGSDN